MEDAGRLLTPEVCEASDVKPPLALPSCWGGGSVIVTPTSQARDQV
jgi:hypothetical protein